MTTTQPEANGTTNLLIFERVLGARRVKLAIGLWAHTYRNMHWPLSLTDAEAADGRAWARHYAGPNFVGNLNWLRNAEAALAARGLLGPYVRGLVDRVYPHWTRIAREADVLSFWFALAHADAGVRAAVIVDLVRPAR